MARLWINNVPPGFGEVQARELLARYGFPPFARAEAVGGADGGRPAIVLCFDPAVADEELLRRLQPRIHGLFVGDRTLHVQVAPPARPEPA